MHALSLPTWWIHIASVAEWIAAIFLVWGYARTTRRYYWRALAWGMLPALLGAMCALTWHFFDNDPHLDWIVTAQAALTLVGNSTLALAAFWIWRQSRWFAQQEKPPLAEGSQSPSEVETQSLHSETPDADLSDLIEGSRS